MMQVCRTEVNQSDARRTKPAQFMQSFGRAGTAGRETVAKKPARVKTKQNPVHKD
jgi:hypothetical protein